MALLRFFKVPKNQKFDYKPRYWDPKKEALEERLSKYRDKHNDAGSVKDRLRRNGFKGTTGRSTLGFKESRAIRNKELRRSNRILLFTVLALVVISYVLFEVYLSEIVRLME